MPVLGAEEDVFVAWAPWWLGVAAGAFPAAVSAEMPGEEFLKEGWHIHRADRSVFGAAAVEAAIQLVELPGDVHRLAVDAVRGKADVLTGVARHWWRVIACWCVRLSFALAAIGLLVCWCDRSRGGSGQPWRVPTTVTELVAIATRRRLRAADPGGGERHGGRLQPKAQPRFGG
jgi:hypothetical protein